jgi:hypothetical protein
MSAVKIPDYAIKIILALVFVCAAGARFASTSSSLYQYFRGESAMNYRDALTVSTASGVDVLDRHTDKSNWPEGYRPARVRPVGVEYFAGFVIKTAAWLGEDDSRSVTRRLVVLFFSLCVFTMYSLTRNLWGSQAAGLTAAALVALFPPVVAATNGRDFGHTAFALVVVTLHLLSLQRIGRAAVGSAPKRWIASTAGTALTAFALVASWALAPYYIAVCCAIATLFYPLTTTQRRVLAVTHLAAFVAGAVVFPYSVASRVVFTWPAALLVACCTQTFVAGRFPGVKRGGAFVALVTVALTLGFTPLRAGAEGVGIPGMVYAWYRIRFLFARPESPALLPESIRDLWSSDHAHPGAHALIAVSLPLLFFLPVAVVEAHRLWRDRDAGYRARVTATATAAALGVAVYTVDRSAIALALVMALPFVALAARALGGASRTRAAVAIVGALIVTGQLLWPQGVGNAALQVSRALGVAYRDKTKLLWVSTANTDEELNRFVVKRTSTKDPIFGIPEATAILLTFGGRTSVSLEGGYAKTLSRKRADMARLLYGNEDQLYLRCRNKGIRYVLYSIDYLLDTTRYSQLYLAGFPVAPLECVAVTMHFAPEALTHFNLVYENDRYRLFRVTDQPEPVFLTDHPPVYQREILERHGDDYDSFRDRIGRLMLVYSEAGHEAARGRFDAAIARLMWCVQEAPGFTAARVALGAALLDNGEPGRAKSTLMSVIRYAPDNADALYLAADAMSRLGENEQALSLLQILYGITEDTKLIGRARLLESLIRRGASAPDSSGAAPQR